MARRRGTDAGLDELTRRAVADAPGTKRAPRRRSRVDGLAATRGLALFFGVFSLANALTLFRGRPGTEDIWWIDLSFLPQGVAPIAALVAAALLLWWGAVPKAKRSRRIATSLAALGLAVAACINAAAFFEAIGAGGVRSALPVPSSVLIALAFAWIAVSAWKPRSRHGRLHDGAVVLAVASLVVVFPVVQMLSFGVTDYRRPADAAVIFGAKAYANGVLSTSLSDRVRTGVDLYKAGLVERLVMSGAVGASGADESEAMKRWAVAKGVPARAILLDHAGRNTDASVRNTGELFERHGIRRVLAVSQFYHLPRIKLAYRAAGRDVWTVPAGMSVYLSGTPGSMLREIPAFWTYWARGLMRQLQG